MEFPQQRQLLQARFRLTWNGMWPFGDAVTTLLQPLIQDLGIVDGVMVLLAAVEHLGCPWGDWTRQTCLSISEAGHGAHRAEATATALRLLHGAGCPCTCVRSAV